MQNQLVFPRDNRKGDRTPRERAARDEQHLRLREDPDVQQQQKVDVVAQIRQVVTKPDLVVGDETHGQQQRHHRRVY